MKNIFYIITLSMLALACGSQSEEPTDLKSMKAFVKEKKIEVSNIEAEIEKWQKEIEKLEPKKENQILVRVDSVGTGEFNRFTKLQASVVSDDYANVSSETGGRITSLVVKEGHSVRKGQLIATVDLDALEKQKNEVETSLELARTVYERQKRLWDQEIGSEIQYLQAKNSVDRLEKTIATIESNLKKKNLYAPISGVVDREFLKSGEMASPGMPIINILNTNNLKVVADVPETYLAKIKRGDNVKIFFPAIEEEMNKRINLVGRSIDPSNRTFKIEVNIPNKGGILKPNLLAEVEINDFSLPQAITIPVDIIQEEINGKKYVFVAKKMGEEYRASKIYIKTGESYKGQVVIESGLSGGELIVTEGARALTENILLKLS